MARSNTVSEKDNSAIQAPEQLKSLETVYKNLQRVFAEEDYQAFETECENIASYLHKYPQPVYSPIKFDPTKHQQSDIIVKEYLELLPDVDDNADLKSKDLIPLEIFCDGDVLFRAVASLIGCSEKEDLFQLKLRCLVDAVCNSSDYVRDYKELQRAARNPDQASTKNWSPFIQEKDRIDPPNIITVYILFALAKIINIPIRSVYLTPSTDELNGKPYHSYHLVNRIFNPPGDKQHNIENLIDPINIIWWYSEINGVTYYDRVIPLFPINKNSENPLSYSISSTELPAIISQPVRRRGTYILIAATVANSKDYQTLKRIECMKIAIIELMKLTAKNADPNDIIEINICKKELMEPPLIPFCNAVEVDTQENFDLINSITFCDDTFSNLSICICAGTDKLTRQSTYHDNFYFFVDSLFDDATKTSFGDAVIRRLRESRRMGSQIVASSSDQSNFEKQRFESKGIARIDYIRGASSICTQVTNLYKENNPSKKIQEPETLVKSKTIIRYEKNNSSKTIQESTISILPISNDPGKSVKTNVIVRYENMTDSMPITVDQNQQNSDRSTISRSLPSDVLNKNNNNNNKSCSSTNYDFSRSYDRRRTGSRLGFP